MHVWMCILMYNKVCKFVSFISRIAIAKMQSPTVVGQSSS